MTWTEPLNLSFAHLERERIRRKEAYPVRLRQVTRVVVTFEDGTSEAYNLPVGAGFFRERYTWEQEDRSRKFTARLDISEIFWAQRSEVNGSTGSSQAIR